MDEPESKSTWRERARRAVDRIDRMTTRTSAIGTRICLAIGELVLGVAGFTLGTTGIIATFYTATSLNSPNLVVIGFFLTGALGSALAGFLMAARRRVQLARRILGTLATGSFAMSLAYLTLGPAGDKAFEGFLGATLLFTFFLFLSLVFEPDTT
jgi:hypothetical protein